MLAKSWGDYALLNPFVVTLTDSEGSKVASKTFQDGRTFYVWEDVYRRARHVRLDSLQYDSPKYFVLCNVEVYDGSSERAPWPSLSLLSVKISKPGQSCKRVCADAQMVCEHAHFRFLNSRKALKNAFKCSSSRAISQK